MGADDARMGKVSDTGRSDGKHGMPRTGSLDSAVRLRFLPDRLTGTAGCGAVRPLRGEISLQADMSGGVGAGAD